MSFFRIAVFNLRPNILSATSVIYYLFLECCSYIIFPQTVRYITGGARAQAVSRRILTAEARVPSQVSTCEIVVDKVALGQVFLTILRFPLSVSFQRCSIFTSTHVSSGGSTKGPSEVQFHRDIVSPRRNNNNKKGYYIRIRRLKICLV
jgi:hypothetical protein